MLSFKLLHKALTQTLKKVAAMDLKLKRRRLLNQMSLLLCHRQVVTQVTADLAKIKIVLKIMICSDKV